jgi:hypothetical protein
MKYFKNCEKIEDVKDLYRTLAKQYHPDANTGIDDTIIKEINNEYEFICAKFASGNVSESENIFDNAMMFKDKIDSIINIPNIFIEIVGNWVWITGDTRPAKNEIKEAGYFWAHKKSAWYWYPEGFGGGRGKHSLSELRVKYGSTIVNNQNQKKCLNK